MVEEANASGEKAVANLKGLKHLYRKDKPSFEEIREHLGAYVGHSRAKLRKTLQQEEVDYQLNLPDVDQFIDSKYTKPKKSKSNKKNQAAAQPEAQERSLHFYQPGVNKKKKKHDECKKPATATRAETSGDESDSTRSPHYRRQRNRFSDAESVNEGGYTSDRSKPPCSRIPRRDRSPYNDTRSGRSSS